MGINLVQQNENVGKFLHDHPSVSFYFQIKDEFMEKEIDGCGTQATGFYQSSWAKKNTPNDGPDMQILCNGSSGCYKSLISNNIVSNWFNGKIPKKGEIFFNLFYNVRNFFSFVLPKIPFYSKKIKKTWWEKNKKNIKKYKKK